MSVDRFPLYDESQRNTLVSRVLFPWITEKPLMQRVRRMLWENGLMTSPCDLPVWYWLAHKTYRDLLDNGVVHATALAASIRDQYVTWGYSAETAHRVVLMLGLDI